MTTLPPGDADPLLLLDRIGSLIGSTRRHVAEGRRVDVTALTDLVKDLCRAVADEPPDDTADILIALQGLVAELDALEEVFLQNAPEGGGDGGQAAQQARAAYGAKEE